jgi:NTP pyrophosphatase (non-canonical NTP hydrolase)
MDSLEELKNKIDRFSEDRDWTKFHSPANLAKSISIEAAELLECFQWDEANFSEENVKEELADVLNYSIRLASILNLDVRQIVLEKLEKNEEKYPVEKSRGRSAKYDRL